jgi:tRNA acetyltransferase TAN1
MLHGVLLTVVVLQNVCGMSVVGKEFEKLKRFNLSEIYQVANAPGNTAQEPPP